jgi:hypothetical protein
MTRDKVRPTLTAPGTMRKIRRRRRQLPDDVLSPASILRLVAQLITLVGVFDSERPASKGCRAVRAASA